MRRKRRLFKQEPVALISFRSEDRHPIKLVSDRNNAVYVDINFKLVGVTSEEVRHPAYLLPDGRKEGLKAALIGIMEEERFSNFYPDLLVDDPEAGFYAGEILKRSLVSNLQRMRPDFQGRKLTVESVVVSFSPVSNESVVECR